ncbi:hypothetical protein HYFRA_00004641 [Hymenoscyphus fraxineus]|uniref:Uncharacterized protein n=1 Tax=Hymenoscyphus fraxineus TaxID=746836 RepID=A0A9N9KY51_9HELO|nr:hypothetical protein HYFRA_00004641 [Hymenoscyphus fraxineus]
MAIEQFRLYLDSYRYRGVGKITRPVNYDIFEFYKKAAIADMRSTSFILPALAVVCHGAALPFHIRDAIEAREPQILEPSPTRTVIVGPTPPSWPWTLPPLPHPTWPPKPPKPSSKSSSTKKEPTTWLTYTYPACPQPTQSTPVLTVPIDKREPQTLGWPTRTASIPVASPTKACISQPYATPSRSTSWGGPGTTRTIPVITVPISDFAPIPTIEAEAREYTRTIQWEGVDTTRGIPPMTVPITARNVEYTRTIDWQDTWGTDSYCYCWSYA